MFTGIVQAIGKIAATAPKGDGLRLAVVPGALDVAEVGIPRWATASRSTAAASP